MSVIKQHKKDTVKKQWRMLAVAVTLLVLSTFSLQARADCTNPTAVAGVQIFNASHSVMQYCNGTSWISMDGSYDGSIPMDNLGDHTATKDLNMNSFNVNNLPTPTAASHAATKAYVDSLTGSGNETDPQVGTLANNMYCKGTGSAIQCTYAVPAPDPIKMAMFVDEKTDGTDGGTATTGSWQTRTLNTTKYNNIGASLSGNAITLPAGLYFFDATMPFYRTYNGIPRLVDTSDNSVLFYGSHTFIDNDSASGNGVANAYLRGIINSATSITVRMEYNVGATVTTTGLGRAVSGYGPEIYSTVQISRIGAYEAPPPPPPCGGTEVGGGCWYLGADNQSCTSVCASHGGYDALTESYAGSAGSDSHCSAVLDALGTGNGIITTTTWASYAGMGCFANSANDGRRYTAGAATAGASYSVAYRACACSN